MFDGELSVLEIANRHNLDFQSLYEYILEFKKKKLVSLELEEIKKNKTIRFKDL